MVHLALACLFCIPIGAAPPLEPGIYRFNGCPYECHWEAHWLFVRPVNGGDWTGEGIMVNGRLEIHWFTKNTQLRDAVGRYTIKPDGRSMVGSYSYLGDDHRHRELVHWDKGRDE